MPEPRFWTAGRTAGALLAALGAGLVAESLYGLHDQAFLQRPQYAALAAAIGILYVILGLCALLRR